MFLSSRKRGVLMLLKTTRHLEAKAQYPDSTCRFFFVGLIKINYFVIRNLVTVIFQAKEERTRVRDHAVAIPAPVAVACRDAKSNPCFTRTVVLQITSMGNLSEK
jgi:hypothetical protein